eukprot:23639-Pelagococcus_subviridis.AAC.1
MSMHAMTAAAPGGCTLPVHIMNASDIDTASARLHHAAPKQWKHAATTAHDAIVATTQLYHRATGLSIVPNASMEIVPHAPCMNGSPSRVFIDASRRPSTLNVTKHTSAPQKMSLVGRFWTSGPPARFGSAMREYGSSASSHRRRPG